MWISAGIKSAWKAKKMKRKKEEEKGKLLLPARVKEGELMVWAVSVKNSSRFYPGVSVKQG